MALWSSRSFLTLKEDWEESTQEKTAKTSTNIKPNKLEYKVQIGLSPLGLPQLTVGLSATSGKL